MAGPLTGILAGVLEGMSQAWRGVQTRGTNPTLYTNTKKPAKPKGKGKGC